MHEVLITDAGPPYYFRCMNCQTVSLDQKPLCVAHECEENNVREDSGMVSGGDRLPKKTQERSSESANDSTGKVKKRRTNKIKGTKNRKARPRKKEDGPVEDRQEEGSKQSISPVSDGSECPPVDQVWWT